MAVSSIFVADTDEEAESTAGAATARDRVRPGPKRIVRVTPRPDEEEVDNDPPCSQCASLQKPSMGCNFLRRRTDTTTGNMTCTLCRKRHIGCQYTPKKGSLTPDTPMPSLPVLKLRMPQELAASRAGVVEEAAAARPRVEESDGGKLEGSRRVRAAIREAADAAKDAAWGAKVAQDAVLSLRSAVRQLHEDNLNIIALLRELVSAAGGSVPEALVLSPVQLRAEVVPPPRGPIRDAPGGAAADSEDVRMMDAAAGDGSGLVVGLDVVADRVGGGGDGGRREGGENAKENEKGKGKEMEKEIEEEEK